MIATEDIQPAISTALQQLSKLPTGSIVRPHISYVPGHNELDWEVFAAVAAIAATAADDPDVRHLTLAAPRVLGRDAQVTRLCQHQPVVTHAYLEPVLLTGACATLMWPGRRMSLGSDASFKMLLYLPDPSLHEYEMDVGYIKADVYEVSLLNHHTLGACSNGCGAAVYMLSHAHACLYAKLHGVILAMREMQQCGCDCAVCVCVCARAQFTPDMLTELERRLQHWTFIVTHRCPITVKNGSKSSADLFRAAEPQRPGEFTKAMQALAGFNWRKAGTGGELNIHIEDWYVTPAFMQELCKLPTVGAGLSVRLIFTECAWLQGCDYKPLASLVPVSYKSWEFGSIYYKTPRPPTPQQFMDILSGVSARGNDCGKLAVGFAETVSKQYSARDRAAVEAHVDELGLGRWLAPLDWLAPYR